MKGWFLTVLVGVFLAAGCTLNEDDYKIKKISASPELVLPLASGHLSIQDILNQLGKSFFIKVYSDGLVYVQYKNELASQDIRNLVEVPDLGTINRTLAFPPGTYGPSATDVESSTISSTIDMGINPERLTEIEFKEGRINYNMALAPINSNIQFSVKIEIPEFISNTSGAPFVVYASGAGSAALLGYTFKSAVPNKFTLKQTLIINRHTNTYVVTPGSNVSIGVNYSGVNFKQIKGFFGDQVANPPAQTLRIGTFGNFLEDGSVTFAQPKVSLDVVNDYGVPLQVSFSTLQARKSNASINILINPTSPINVQQPAQLGSSATTSVAVTNVNQIFNFGPSELYYKVSGHINAGLTSGVNFMADTSKMRVRLHVELPLYGKATNIVLDDTTDLSLDFNINDVSSSHIKAYIKNELPLDGVLQIYLLDKNDNVIESLLNVGDGDIIVGSKVNSSGDLVEPGLYNGDIIEISGDKLEKLSTADKLAYKVVLNTSKDNTGNQVNVKFKSNLKIEIKMGLQLNFKFSKDL